jgi:hypothetical protein
MCIFIVSSDLTWSYFAFFEDLGVISKGSVFGGSAGIFVDLPCPCPPSLGPFIAFGGAFVDLDALPVLSQVVI